MPDIYDKYSNALDLISNISAILPDTPENKPIRILLKKWADEL